MHRQLIEQIRAHLGNIDIEERWKPLFAAISSTYEQSDEERNMLIQQNSYLEALHHTTFGLLNQHDQKTLLREIVTRATALLGTPDGGLFVIDPEGNKLVLEAASGIFTQILGGEIERGAGLCGRVWDLGKALTVYNYIGWAHRLPTLDPLQLHTVISVPLTSHGAVIGVFTIAYAETEHAFYQSELELIDRFAQLASLAIENVKLYNELELRVLQRTIELEEINQELEREIAERMRTEGRLRERETTYRLLTEYATDVISRHSPDGTYLYVSPASATTLGYLPNALLGRNMRDFIHPDDVRTITHFTTELLDKVNNYSISMRFRRSDGSYIWLETTTRVIRHPESNQAAALIAVSRDISERKRVELALEEERQLLAMRVEERTADLRRANIELARAARLKDEFLANMSHELRTPLNGILGLSESLQEEVYGPLIADQNQALQIIIESGRHLLALINDILDLSKIEAGMLTIERHQIEIPRVCEMSLRMIRQSAVQKKIHVETSIDPAATIMYADERRLKQILVNLLGNAVKFTPEDRSIGLHVTTNAEDDTIQFRIWDTGIGIAKEDLGRLFQPFTQLDSKLSRQYEGTGLGLVLVARMVDLHGGSIQVTSEPGKGSQFTITLPWHPIGSENLHELALIEGEPALPMRHSAHKRTILIADDNEINLLTFSDYLRQKGFQIVIARNETDIYTCLSQSISLILMDIQMPKSNGLDIIRTIRQQLDKHQLPIIALTALAMPNDRETSLAAGANAYLSKPVSLRELVSTIEHVLSTYQEGKSHGTA